MTRARTAATTRARSSMAGPSHSARGRSEPRPSDVAGDERAPTQFARCGFCNATVQFSTTGDGQAVERCANDDCQGSTWHIRRPTEIEARIPARPRGKWAQARGR